MNELLKTIVEKVTGTAHKMKETVEHFTQWDSISIENLVNQVQSNPNTDKKTFTALNLTFHFYEFTQDRLIINIETKGNQPEYILYVSVIYNNEEVLTYRSYDEKSTINDVIKIPPTLTTNS